MTTETKTFYPQAYDKSDYSVQTMTGPENPVGKGSSNSSNYAAMLLTHGKVAETKVRWPFDCSGIPAGATIDSVSCNVAASITRTDKNYVGSRTLQLCSGTTAKGSATTIVGTSRSVHTLNCGSWTRDELQKANLYIYAKRAKNNYTDDTTIYFYGADLTVAYTVNNEKFMLKLGGSWTDVARVFKRVNGIWVEQTELSSVVEDGVRYQNGGEYVSPKKTVTITGTGDNNASTTAAECYVEINGVKYVSATTVEVDSGTTMLCYAYANLESITLNGSSVGSGTPKQYTHTVNENCRVKLSVEVSLISKATIDITTQ